MLAKILKENRLEPVSVCCKTGGVDKTEDRAEARRKILEDSSSRSATPSPGTHPERSWDK
jgi:uncharacterized metal-binding protein